MLETEDSAGAQSPIVDLDALQVRISVAEQATADCQRRVEQLVARVQDMLQLAQQTVERIVSAGNSAASNSAVLQDARSRAELTLNEIELARRKADSESGYAFNAKGNAEEHAKAIAQIRGTVEATFGALSTTKSSIDQIAQEISATKGLADSQLKATIEAKTTSDRLGAEIAAVKNRVDAVLPAIEAGARDANLITAGKAGVDANAAAIQALQTQMSEVVGKAEADRTSLAESDVQSKVIIDSMKETQRTANGANERVSQYEQEIATFVQAFTDTQGKLESLLPHATSAGLASAFHVQKARFSKTQPRWLWLFVIALLSLMLASFVGAPVAGNDTWDAILRHLVNRLPFIGPLVWLAIYSGHQYNLALRMEEDYAFKEALSTAFEGYKREMLGIEATAGSDVKPLVTLCENVLNSLAERPGRIYDAKTDVVTPMTPILTTLKDIAAQLPKSNGKGSQP